MMEALQENKQKDKIIEKIHLPQWKQVPCNMTWLAQPLEWPVLSFSQSIWLLPMVHVKKEIWKDYILYYIDDTMTIISPKATRSWNACSMLTSDLNIVG